MHPIEFKDQSQKVFAQVHVHLDYIAGGYKKKDFLDCLLNEVEANEVGYAGCRTIEWLREHLASHIFGYLEVSNLPAPKYNKEQILQTLQFVLSECQQVLPSQKAMHVYVFPCFNPFTKESLKGVGGFCPYNNVCHLFLCQDFNETALQDTLAHEYNHAFIMHRWSTLLDSLVFEGLAEHFREHILQGPKANYVTAVSKAECHKHFRNLQTNLDQTDLHDAVFFDQESLQYPHWLGYSLGYHIVESFLKQNPNKTWSEIMQIEAEDILKPFKSEL